MEDSENPKRPREDSGEESPETKRLRADDILGIFDVGDDAGGDITAGEDLAYVMRSLEEEITIPSPGTDFSSVSPCSGDPRESDLGYLLEASDDELGLPPATTAVSSPEREGDVTASGEGEAEEEEEEGGFGQIWGFDDAIAGCYEGLEFGIRPEAAVAADEVVELDGGLFDYSDMACGPSDFADLAWRSETLPAL
ncbi:uncharacterized protein [Typha latifolia]|uniref:uncharacterized protein n=1 Tax=Typha latifolia TaxID=4733 RepID=UPI003C309B5B